MNREGDNGRLLVEVLKGLCTAIVCERPTAESIGMSHMSSRREQIYYRDA